MAAKTRRHELIRSILGGARVENQEDLRSRLETRGVYATQATLSRDLRELGVLRGPGGYTLPDSLAGPQSARDAGHELSWAAAELLLSATPAGTLTVVRTGPGNAPAMALRLDRSGWPDIVGTVAGDDTVLIATRSSHDAAIVASRLMALAAGKNKVEGA